MSDELHMLVLGGTGQVGRELLALPLPAHLRLFAPGRDIVDFENPNAVRRVVGSQSWSAIINAAAYTDVDRAESEEARAFAVNALAVSTLAIEAARHGTPVVHISTDYVFDGRKGQCYIEQDPVAPLNAYGRTKLAGEWALAASNKRHVIIRTSWVYSPYGRNFLRSVLKLARERDRLTIVGDQLGRPTAAKDVAQVCLSVAIQCATNRDKSTYGTYHFADAGHASWFEFASCIIQKAQGRLHRRPQLVSIGSTEYPTAAVRPADSRLDCSAIKQAFGIVLPDWQTSLSETIERVFEQEKKI
jgi:dTDP-4-dehydrorhamnose reductase